MLNCVQIRSERSYDWCSNVVQLRDAGAKFKGIPQKQDTVYLPPLVAFIREKTIHANTERMMQYLIGMYDFYMVVKENESILLQYLNIGGTLKWGKKVPLPKRIISCEMKDGSKTTAIMYMDKG